MYVNVHVHVRMYQPVIGVPGRYGLLKLCSHLQYSSFF
jgi:hypothetical protein